MIQGIRKYFVFLEFMKKYIHWQLNNGHRIFGMDVYETYVKQMQTSHPDNSTNLLVLLAVHL